MIAEFDHHRFSEEGESRILEPDAMPNESTDHRGLRLRRDPTPSYPLFGWRYPGRSVYWDLETDKDGFIPNDKGLSSAVDRDAEVSIWMVGGSTVAGSGASANNRTISAQLEALLRKKGGPTVSVVNAGVGGWYSQNELAFITQELLPLHGPDAMIVMNGYNDTWSAVVAGAKFRTDKRGRAISDGNYLYDPRLENDVRRWSGREPTSRSVVADSETNGTEATEASQQLRPSLNVLPYLGNVRTTVAAAMGWQTPILYILQPSVVYKTKLTPQEYGVMQEVRRTTLSEGKWRAYRAGKGCDFDDIQRRFFDTARPGFLELAEDFNGPGVRLVDFSERFATNTEDLFYDYCHYTDRGNELLAEGIAEELSDFTLIPPTPRYFNDE